MDSQTGLYVAAATLAKTFYADTVNQQFHKKASQYVSIPQRLKQTVAGQSYYQTLVSQAVLEFRRRNPQIAKWTDIKLCRPGTTTLDKIVIDITLQRMLDIIHALGILDGFKQIRVMPISVYEDPAAPGQYVCWDGQHTAIVLYMIAHALNTDLADCEVPIVIYPSSLKSEMRENFMELNGNAKQPLAAIDFFHQKVFGVRTDGNLRPDWVLSERKQQALEGAKMFATAAKFGDTLEPGALTRLDELEDTRYDLVITENFCEYFVNICASSRPVEPKECWLLYEYFRACQLEHITVDSAYIAGVAASLKRAFGGDFDPIKMMLQAKESYRQHYQKREGHTWGIRYPEKPLGLTFLIQQIGKNFTGKTPRGPQHWPVNPADLF
jgi:hypothetical protein